MNTTTLGYILLITIPIIITLAILAIKRRNKEVKIEPQLGAVLRNGIMGYELEEIEQTLEAYIKFLKTVLPQSLPEVQQEIDQVKKTRRFARNLRIILENYPLEKEFSQQEWKRIIGDAHMMAQFTPTKFTDAKEIDKVLTEADREIEDLKDKGYLPRDYPKASQIISPAELRKVHQYPYPDTSNDPA